MSFLYNVPFIQARITIFFFNFFLKSQKNRWPYTVQTQACFRFLSKLSQEVVLYVKACSKTEIAAKNLYSRACCPTAMNFVGLQSWADTKLPERHTWASKSLKLGFMEGNTVHKEFWNLFFNTLGLIFRVGIYPPCPLPTPTYAERPPEMYLTQSQRPPKLHYASQPVSVALHGSQRRGTLKRFLSLPFYPR